MRWVCLVCVLACISVAQAEAPLTATQLHELCRTWHSDPDSVAAASRAAYVRGFLDGAADIDERTASARDQLPGTTTERVRGANARSVLPVPMIRCNGYRSLRGTSAASSTCTSSSAATACRLLSSARAFARDKPAIASGNTPSGGPGARFTQR